MYYYLLFYVVNTYYFLNMIERNEIYVTIWTRFRFWKCLLSRRILQWNVPRLHSAIFSQVNVLIASLIIYVWSQDTHRRTELRSTSFYLTNVTTKPHMPLTHTHRHTLLAVYIFNGIEIFWLLMELRMLKYFTFNALSQRNTMKSWREQSCLFYLSVSHIVVILAVLEGGKEL